MYIFVMCINVYVWPVASITLMNLWILIIIQYDNCFKLAHPYFVMWHFQLMDNKKHNILVKLFVYDFCIAIVFFKI